VRPRNGRHAARQETFIVPRIVKFAFWLAATAVLVVALLPGRDAPQLGWDKLMHFSAFAALTTIALLGYGRSRPLLVGALMSGFGALIEVLQGLPLFHRDASVADWIADTLAVIAVLTAAWIVSRVRTALA
jgi:VanZ family protein